MALNGSDLNKINEIRNQDPGELKMSLGDEGGGWPHLVMPHEAYMVGLTSLQATAEPEPEFIGLRVIDTNGADFESIFDLIETRGVAKEPQKHTDKGFLNQYQNAFVRMFGGDLEAKNYEVRSLKIPALHVETIWLYKETDDLYIPVQSMGLFQDDVIYKKAEFYQKLREAAKGYNISNDEMGG